MKKREETLICYFAISLMLLLLNHLMICLRNNMPLITAKLLFCIWCWIYCQRSIKKETYFYGYSLLYFNYNLKVFWVLKTSFFPRFFCFPLFYIKFCNYHATQMVKIFFLPCLCLHADKNMLEVLVKKIYTCCF